MHQKINVGNATVGTLLLTDRDSETYTFLYEPEVKTANAVSLTMPPHELRFETQAGMPPIFDANLPEGYLRAVLQKMFAKALPHFNDLQLLQIVGKHQLGRVQVAGEKVAIEPISLTEILTHKGADDLFKDMLHRYAKYSGISGMQPKLLAPVALNPSNARKTYKDTTHIIKSFDSKEYFELALNEYFCLKAAANAGIQTVNAVLSDNCDMLVVERFDTNDDGSFLGIEDLAALRGFRSNGRYEGGYEQCAKTISQYSKPLGKKHNLTVFYQQFLLSCMVGNGDAHLKNFSVTYRDTDDDIRLSPLYDVVCTQCYFPHDTLALTLAGDKRFPSRAQLIDFGKKHCFVASDDANAMIDRIAEAVLLTANELEAYGNNADAQAKRAAPIIAKCLRAATDTAAKRS